MSICWASCGWVRRAEGDVGMRLGLISGWGGGRLEADKCQLRIANAIGKRLGYFRRGSTAHAADV